MYEIFQTNKALSDLCTLGIGGPAKYYIEVKEIDQMQKLLSFCSKEKLAFFVLGRGSNCLFDSAGLKRVVIHNKIDFCHESENSFHVGAGYSFSLLGTQTAKKGWTGLEFASGIPASVGGAVFMNAGAQGQSTFDTLLWVDYVHADGTLVRLEKDEITHSYRTTAFQKMQGAVVSACFSLKPLKNARAQQLELLQKRICSQPYQDKTAGCVFKNPANASAGALIDSSGLKGFQIGDAKVSELHANFLVNASSATSTDMRALIAHVQKRVKELHGIDLQTEVFWITDDDIPEQREELEFCRGIALNLSQENPAPKQLTRLSDAGGLKFRGLTTKVETNSSPCSGIGEPKADLHTHSTCSDGTFTPAELIAAAKASGLIGLSITDHDTVAAYPEAFELAKENGIALISGVELSCIHDKETVHILGYSFDPKSDVMLERTAVQRKRRLERNAQILEKLKKQNIILDESEIANSSHPTYTYGRVHIAQAMVKKGYVPTVIDAFKLYLGNSKSCYVEGSKWTVEEGIDIIRQSKGLAVLAHPHLISSSRVCRKLLQMPFDGIEAYYSRANMAENEKWIRAAEKNGWFITGGSDFHGSVKPDVKLGCSYTPYNVFLALQEHFHGL